MAQPSYYVETPDGKKVQLDVPEGASAEQIRTLAGRALKQKFPDAKYARPAMSREASQSLLPESARGELKADDTALSKVQGGVRSALEAVGVGDRYGAHLAGRVTGALNDLTPVGDAVTLSDAKDAWNSGNYLSAIGKGALAGIGLVPGVGDGLAAGGKGALAMFLGAKPALKWGSATPAAHEASALAQGFTVEAYHGTARPDRIIDADQFNPRYATSGPMPFFTDDPKIASNYAEGKMDTSRLAEDDGNFADWFKADIGRGKAKNLDQLWHNLTPEQQAKARANLGRVTQEEDYLPNGEPNPNGGKFYLGDGPGGQSHWAYTLREHRGNPIKAAEDIWLSSGNLYGEEEKFIDVMRSAGIDVPLRYDSPQMSNPGIIPVKLRMGNTLESGDEYAMKNLLAELDAKAKGKRYKSGQKRGVDMWDKTDIGIREFVDDLRADVTAGRNPLAFTRIPDEATDVMRGMGFESITDTGGKMGGAGHTVYIPFSPEQVRSRYAPFAAHELDSPYLLGEVARGRP